MFTTLIIINDYGINFLNLPYNISLVIVSLSFLIIYTFYIRNRIEFEFFKLKKMDYIAIGIILFSSLLQICTPDRNFDTHNYHIYIQELWSNNHVLDSFFPGRMLNTHSLPLGDRMFYLFRYILGFRLGVILNTLVIILIYLQSRDIIKKYCEINNLKCNSFIYTMMGIMVLFFENIIWYQNTYYIDLLIVPFILEIIRRILYIEKQEKIDVYLMALMGGITLSIKVSNAPVVAFLGIWYLIRYKDCVTVKSIINSIIIILFPLLVYLIVNYIDTGNPVYPYFNSIFRSEYFFTDVNFNEWIGFSSRYGANNLIEYILWPFIMILSPFQVNDAEIYSGRVLVAFVCAVIYIKQVVKEKGNIILSRILSLFFVFYLIYLVIMEGYIRYFVAFEVLCGILIGIFLIEMFNKRRKIIGYTICIALGIQIIYLGYQTYIDVKDWVWRVPIYKDVNNYLNNAKMMFRDRESGISQDALQDIDAWIIGEYNSGQSALLKKDIPMISINAGVSNEKTQQIYNEHLQRLEGKNLYSLVQTEWFYRGIEELGNNGFVVENMRQIKPNFINTNSSLTLIKVKYETAKTMNIYNLTNNEELEEIDININSKSQAVDIYVGFDPTVLNWANSDGFYVKVELIGDNSNTVIYDEEVTQEYKFDKITINEQDLKNVSDIRIKRYDKQGKEIYTDYLTVIIVQ